MTPHRGVVVTALGASQTLAWASTYYLPAVMADPVAGDLGIARSLYFALFSAALLLSGLVGPLAGRLIDRHGGRDVLAASSVVFALGLVLMAASRGPVGLGLGWMVLGLGMGFGLYEAAFATVAGLYGRDARNAITGITLFAGFASTVGWPASAVFIDLLGWRGACLAWAGLHLLVGLPMNRLVVPKALAPPVTSGGTAGSLSAPMAVLAAVFAACWFVSAAMAAHLPRLLEALGAGHATAVGAAALIGPAQVAARVAEFAVLRRASPLLSARLASGLHPLGAVVLAVVGAKAAMLFAVLHGAGNGLLTIARGTLPLALFGAEGYGLRSGILAAPARLLQGAAPLLFSLVLDDAGPRWALALSGSLTLAALFGLWAVQAMLRRSLSRADPVRAP